MTVAELPRDLRRAAPLTPSLLHSDRFSSPVPVAAYKCPLSLREKDPAILPGYVQEGIPGDAMLLPLLIEKTRILKKNMVIKEIFYKFKL